MLIGEAVVKAFRVDLACWSAYFRKLFSSDFKDSKSSTVNVEEADPVILKGLIQALYEKKVNAFRPTGASSAS